MKSKKILILSDGKLGHQNQSVRVVENLGCSDYDILVLKRRPFGKILSHIKPESITSDIPLLRSVLKGAKYDIVIGAGTVPRLVMLWIKKQYPQLKTICLMNPKHNHDMYDVIAVPSHDQINYNGDNMIRFTGALSGLSKEDFSAAKEYFKEDFAKFKNPLIGVLIGGDSKGYKFTQEKSSILVSHILDLASELNASVYATTSRRTGQTQTNYINKNLTDKGYSVYTGEGENPYRGILAYSDIIIVTPETVSMLSEACASQAKVLVFDKDSVTSARVKRFVDELVDKKQVCELDKYIKDDCSKNWNSDKSFMTKQVQTVIDFIKKRI